MQIFSNFFNAPIFVLLFCSLQLICHLGVNLGVCTFIVTTGRLRMQGMYTVQCPVFTMRVMSLCNGYASRVLCNVFDVQSALCE